MSLFPLAVVIAAINEEEGIGPTICELKTILNEPHLVVVDGKSSDKTIEIAKDLGAEVLIQKGKGKGSAISQGLDQLTEKTHYVIFTDADYTYPAKYIKEMLFILEEEPNVGMVLGDRFSRRYQFASDRNQFYVGNRILALAHNVLNGVKLNDPLTGLRVIRYDLLKGWKPKSNGFDIEVELNYFVERLGYKIVEIPIMYRKRLGKKKLGFRHGFKIFERIIIENIKH
ncbi:MAG: glycosyltransferase family 2 protein [Candidatus Lokiarchaeota archaeon]|nr:glycosyltransferase family 2 protein [Candidatus Lokiarchaeota archaeon]